MAQASRKFVYQPRGVSDVKKRGEQSGGNRDNFIKEGIPMFVPAVGDNWIRPFPPTWEGADHYGLDVFVHYNVGPENAAYVCLFAFIQEPCAICEEKAEAEAEGEKEYAESLKPGKRVLVWVINRKDEKLGPLLWSQPWTMDRNFCKLAVDKKTQEVYQIDHPTEGFDLEFERKGTGVGTEYIGEQIARKSSPLGTPEQIEQWLEFVINNSIPDCLQIFPYDHIKAALKAKSKKETASSPENGKVKEEKKEEPAKSSPSQQAAQEEPAKEVVKEEPAAAQPATTGLTPAEKVRQRLAQFKK
jgi:hypothetical protein